MNPNLFLVLIGVFITVVALAALLCPVPEIAFIAKQYSLGVAIGYGVSLAYDGWKSND